LAAELAGRDTAEAIQLAIEYAAAPPYDVGRPDTASPAVRARVAESLRTRRWRKAPLSRPTPP
jgi:cyclohexyl-isocyanide hydratase